MSDLVTGRTGDWEVVIGLEVHAQVSSNAKLFSGASASFGSAPNENVSLVDAAMPGIAASMSDTFSFGADPKLADAPENNLALLLTCA